MHQCEIVCTSIVVPLNAARVNKCPGIGDHVFAGRLRLLRVIEGGEGGWGYRKPEENRNIPTAPRLRTW